MKKLILGMALLGAPLAAQTAPAPAPAAAAKLSIDASIEALVADPAGKAVIDANFPGMTTHPAYDQFKGMTLKAVQPFSNGVITDEAIAKATADLAAIK
jgi:hypothetical protein